MKLTKIFRKLALDVDQLHFCLPVTHVYNPLLYARGPFETYLERFGSGKKEAVLVGMNPGPFGMAQTGVPFGDVVMVREWLGIEEAVMRPSYEHPKRRIEGFNCSRREVSGTRLWNWAKDRFGQPGQFFERFIVINYCPLVFMEESGKNRTPDKLLARERDALFTLCDISLAQVVSELGARFAIGIGAFAEKRLTKALGGGSVAIGRILHPSPASPLANRGWAERVDVELAAIGVEIA